MKTKQEIKIFTQGNKIIYTGFHSSFKEAIETASECNDLIFADLSIINNQQINKLCLAKLSVPNRDLSLSDFSYCDCSDSVFDNSNLRGVIFSHTKLNNSSFKGADITNIKLDYAEIKNIDVKGAKYHGEEVTLLKQIPFYFKSVYPKSMYLLKCKKETYILISGFSTPIHHFLDRQKVCDTDFYCELIRYFDENKKHLGNLKLKVPEKDIIYSREFYKPIPKKDNKTEIKNTKRKKILPIYELKKKIKQR